MIQDYGRFMCLCMAIAGAIMATRCAGGEEGESVGIGRAQGSSSAATQPRDSWEADSAADSFHLNPTERVRFLKARIADRLSEPEKSAVASMPDEAVTESDIGTLRKLLQASDKQHRYLRRECLALLGECYARTDSVLAKKEIADVYRDAFTQAVSFSDWKSREMAWGELMDLLFIVGNHHLLVREFWTALPQQGFRDRNALCACASVEVVAELKKVAANLPAGDDLLREAAANKLAEVHTVMVYPAMKRLRFGDMTALLRDLQSIPASDKDKFVSKRVRVMTQRYAEKQQERRAASTQQAERE